LSDAATTSGAGGPCLLTVNAGSSSIKAALFRARRPPERFASGRIERIGLPGASFTVKHGATKAAAPRPIEAPDHGACVAPLLDWIDEAAGLDRVIAIGHRVVHGGPRWSRPERITPEVLDGIRRLAPMVPEHLPAEIVLIETFLERLPGAVHVACFDTAFHRAMPAVARLLPIPRRYAAAGVERYGFHGLSYQYLMEELARAGGREAAMGRVVLAHLGNGASMAAVRDGKSLDTTMGFTPASGLPMSTRSGDLDPGLVSYLARAEGMTADGFHEMVNARSGLLGVSETSSDVRDLLAREKDDPRAAEAVALFTYQARKWIGALAAALGGLDTLVFSGGIGENSPVIRERICDGLEFLGVRLDAGRNAAGAPVISRDAERVAVRVIRTDEEVQIARAVLDVVDAPGSTKKEDA
jgi:acetate kinase